MSENDNRPWNAEEDAFCVWCFFCAPVASFPSFVDIPGNRTPAQILDHFLTMIKQPLLLERVRQFCSNNICQFRDQIPFSPVEDYYLVNALRLENTSDVSKITKTFGNYFHISRTLAQLRARQFSLNIAGKMHYPGQLEEFKAFKKQLLEKYTEDQLEEIATTVDQLTPYFVEKAKSEPFMQELERVMNDIDQKTQNSFGRGDYAALVGKLGPLKINKAKSIIGRSSQFIGADIDLTQYRVQTVSRRHAEIKLCKDFRFYIECLGSNIIINGTVLRTGEKSLLSHRDIIDIGGCLFIFFQNLEIFKNINENINKE